jgi:acyl-[acyl-carrier-protein] desaturase
MERMKDRALLDATAPVAEALYQRHLAKSKEWFPHQLVPWSQGRDFEPGEVWDPRDYPLPDAVRSALYVNLLTEDNLPYYFHAISWLFTEDGIWGEWNRRWTAEEHRHSTARYGPPAPSPAPKGARSRSPGLCRSPARALPRRRSS